jgi:hypothetical protein
VSGFQKEVSAIDTLSHEILQARAKQLVRRNRVEERQSTGKSVTAPGSSQPIHKSASGEVP